MVAQTYTFPDGLMVWATKIDDGFLRDEDFEEIGNRITPEQKYTESDMLSFAEDIDLCYSDEERRELFERWLKQKEKRS